MKHPILILLTLICTAAFAQKESFDITTYTPPKGWKKEAKEDVITYTMANTKSGNWCQLNILRSTAGKGSIDLDFDNEWQTLVVKSYKPTEAPET
jgi:hypothetical protein